MTTDNSASGHSAILSDDQLAEIEARANAATEGPWEWANYAGDVFNKQHNDDRPANEAVEELFSEHLFQEYLDSHPGEGVPCRSDRLNYDAVLQVIHDEDGCWALKPRSDDDLKFISAARTDIPALLASHRALQARLRELEGKS